MLGLPSSTELRSRLPKNAFYRNLKLSTRLKTSFVNDVEAFTVRNTLKPGTLGVPDGVCVHEVLVLEVAVKRRMAPEAVLTAIARGNAHKLVFVCTFDDCECSAVLLGEHLHVTPWVPAGTLCAPIATADMDAVWDSLASQLVYGDAGQLPACTVEQRHGRDVELQRLQAERERVATRMYKEVQPARKRELHAQVRELDGQIEQLGQ